MVVAWVWARGFIQPQVALHHASSMCRLCACWWARQPTKHNQAVQAARGLCTGNMPGHVPRTNETAFAAHANGKCVA